MRNMTLKFSSRFGFAQAVLVACLAIGFAQSATADTVYTYTGNPYTEFSPSATCPGCAITGSFTVASPLGANFAGLLTPLSYSFTDGQIVWTDLTSTPFFSILTDSGGLISKWGIDLFDTSGLLPATITLVTRYSSPLDALDCSARSDPDLTVNCYADNKFSPGTWTSSFVEGSPAVPEPASLTLFGTGLIGLGTSFWRRKHAA